MNKEVKPKIEAIYPLSNMQTALLFHHFTEKIDQGFLKLALHGLVPASDWRIKKS